MHIEPVWILVAATSLNALLGNVLDPMEAKPPRGVGIHDGLRVAGGENLSCPGVEFSNTYASFERRQGRVCLRLREIAVAVVLALLASVASFAVATFALSFAAQEQIVRVQLDGQPVTEIGGVGNALVSHLAQSLLRDGFAHTGLATSEFSGGGIWLTLLFLSLITVVTGVGIKALSELLRCVRYALVCISFPRDAQQALEGDGPSWVRRLLGLPAI